MSRKRRIMDHQEPVHWLPVDSRLVLPLISFGHVHGVAKVFLTIEMALAVGVVIGTMGMMLLRIFFLK